MPLTAKEQLIAVMEAYFGDDAPPLLPAPHTTAKRLARGQWVIKVLKAALPARSIKVMPAKPNCSMAIRSSSRTCSARYRFFGISVIGFIIRFYIGSFSVALTATCDFDRSIQLI